MVEGSWLMVGRSIFYLVYLRIHQHHFFVHDSHGQLTVNLEPMPRILAIDYGLKRTGIAVTDPLKIIATGLTTVESKQLIPFLKNYFLAEPVELIIIGEPKNWDDTDTHATPLVHKAIR